jgi:hypothetical protein
VCSDGQLEWAWSGDWHLVTEDTARMANRGAGRSRGGLRVVSAGGGLKGHAGRGRGLSGSALSEWGVSHTGHGHQWGVSGRNADDTRGGMLREWRRLHKTAHR